ncbi:putative 60S ribosomal protein L44 [Venustampulla echinocandica]|uniref:Putative 60S ribosomal protein L44 n=1 Tax=Venustampulla echinocandica TaxID=2656787 RepID=A0A370TPV6_9HELO|nr:putative 60S ribosomal protein L44 [Venustampulla echinocandica]RDL37553.1 putative 60S ribosomal protein L44 [Venustampulla echinocandica]
MVPPHLESADARNTFEDLSGVDIAAYNNPYDALIEACHNDPVAQIQARYATHRDTRNGQQREKLLSPEYEGLILDPILQRLTDPSIEPGYQDPRNCIVFWARPPPHIKSLVDRIQQELLKLAPSIWLMPLQNLHLTALEITHSLTAPEITSIITALGDSASTSMVDYPYTHRARIIKPTLSYDGAAIALSFLPAAGEGLPSNSSVPSSSRTREDDNFTYHHLRRDLFNIAQRAGIVVDSRYVVPSSHITLGRFLTQGDHDSAEKMAGWFSKIEEVNQWLEDEYWPKEGMNEGEWIIGQEMGLDYRRGTLWYGGGETVKLGKGF